MKPRNAMPNRQRPVKALYYRVIGKSLKGAIVTDSDPAWRTYLKRAAKRLFKGATENDVQEWAAQDSPRLVVATRLHCLRQVGWGQATVEGIRRDRTGAVGRGRHQGRPDPAGQTARLHQETGVRQPRGSPRRV